MAQPITNALALGAAIRDARAARGWTQEHLADRADVSRGFVIGIERGARSGAELSRVLAVLRALGMAVTLTDSPAGQSTTEDLLGQVLGL